MGKFRAAPCKSRILKVEQGEAPAFTRGQRNKKGAKRAGYLFEDKVNKLLRKKLGRQYVKSPWIRFYPRDEKPRICQPDGMYVDNVNKIVTIVECKYTFCADAWYQINKLYRPVIEAWFPDYTTRGVQVFKNFSPQTKYPEIPEVIEFSEIDAEWDGGNKVCRLTA